MNKIILCGECRWWRKEDNLGECKSPKWQYGYQFRRNEISDDGILVEDDSGWGCWTGPAFGCVHGEIEK